MHAQCRAVVGAEFQAHVANRDAVFIVGARDYSAKIVRRRPTQFRLPSFSIAEGLLDRNSGVGPGVRRRVSSAARWRESIPIAEVALRKR